jgi:hypothetical protein
VISLKCPICRKWIREDDEDVTEWGTAYGPVYTHARCDCQLRCFVCYGFIDDGEPEILWLSDSELLDLQSHSSMHLWVHKSCFEMPADCRFCGEPLGEERVLLAGEHFAHSECVELWTHYYTIKREKEVL